jgi:hypothetical protein
MIISPPYLLARNAGESDQDWINRCMSGGAPGDGAFPLSNALQWHGGLHLREPEANALVRAIADGDVVHLRQPDRQPAGELPADHAQAYRGGWTDNGVVVIRHTTEIGEGANASVTFFSIYMHLREIDAAVQPNRRIYRKSSIGRAGQIYGEAGRLHFEIICDDTNLPRLVGRANGDLNTGSDGRVDAVYGSMYFRLPAGALVYGERPMANNPVAHRQPPRPPGAPANSPLPAPVALQFTHTTAQDLFVGLRYASGEGAAANRGDAYLSTYQLDGTLIGDPLEENDAEYNLYNSATAISKAYPATGRPAPSAVYELLRFGRIIGPDALTPATVPHWRQVRYPGGTGWVNLNAQGVMKCSDADFPHWMGWSLVDDSADQDSRCDSATVKGWLDADGDRSVTPAEAQARMGTAPVAAKLAKAICKFPTEWNAASFDRRLGWLKTSTAENPTPLDDANFERLRAHVTALAFWPGGTGLPESHWHWNPREFVEHFRKCGWFSLNELTQMLPRLHGRRGELASIPWATAENRFRPYAIDLSKAFRKYLILGVNRQVHFLAQTYIETAMWRVVEEIGRARQQRRANGTLYWPAPMMEFYGAFYGRGIMQLTWSGNYMSYGEYRAFAGVGETHTYADARITRTSTHYLGDPRGQPTPVRWYPKFDPSVVADNSFNACDSGAYYWVSKAIGNGNTNINRVCDQGVTTAAVGRASVLVNGGGYGYAERQAYAPYIERFLGDGTNTDATSSFVATRGRTNHNIFVDFTAQRPR